MGVRPGPPGPPIPDALLAKIHAHPGRFADDPGLIRALTADLMAAYDALRAVRVLHDRPDCCGPPNLLRHPCPTAVIIDATMSGYGRGGAWPYSEAAE